MKDFYKKLHETFNNQEVKDKFTSAGIQPIRYIDIYAGQDYNPQLFEIQLYPALFVSWTIDYSQSNPVANLTFRLAYEQMRDFSNLSINKDEALKFIDFIAITDQIIKTIESQNTSKLLLVSEELNIEETVIDVFTLTYQCNYSGKTKRPQADFTTGQYDDIELRKGLYERML